MRIDFNSPAQAGGITNINGIWDIVSAFNGVTCLYWNPLNRGSHPRTAAWTAYNIGIGDEGMAVEAGRISNAPVVYECANEADLEASEQHLAELMQQYVPTQHRAITALFGADLGIVGTAYRSMDLWLMGYPERALQSIDKAVRMARDVAHPESLTWTLLGSSIVHQASGEERQSRIATEELFSVCASNGLVMQSALAKLVHGWTLAVEGDAEHGCAEIRDAFKAFNAPGLVLMAAEGHALLAEAYWFAGNAEQGLLSLEEPLTQTRSEERNFAAELCRLRGELCNLPLTLVKLMSVLKPRSFSGRLLKPPAISERNR